MGLYKASIFDSLVDLMLNFFKQFFENWILKYERLLLEKHE